MINNLNLNRGSTFFMMNKKIGNIFSLSLFFAYIFFCPLFAYSAEYKGKDIDGERFDATAYSYSTSKYYNVEVEFDGDEATIYFKKGGHIVVTLDDDEIDDANNIDAYDYNKSVYWELDIDGLD